MAASAAPLYPIERVLTVEEAVAARPTQLVRIGGYVFAQLDRCWVLVDPASDNGRREVDDA